MSNSREDFALTLRELETTNGNAGGELSTRDPDPAGDVDPDPDTSGGTQLTDRDPTGRFVTKKPDEEQVPANRQPAEKSQVGKVAAPVSWKPEEREHWGEVKPAARAAIVRREREVEAALRTSAQARQWQNDFTQTISPYMAMIEAENTTPLIAIKSLLNTAALLRTGTPRAKAQAVADLICQFEINIKEMDDILVRRLGAPPEDGAAVPSRDLAPEISRLLDDRLRPVMELMQGLRQRGQQNEVTLQQEATASWETFTSDPQNEFALDVQDEIADLLELAAKRNRTMSLQEAYKLATLQHPTISKILKDRQNNSGASQQTAAARRALDAAVSVSSSGGAPSRDGEEDDDGSIRSDLASSIRKLSAQR